MKFLHTADWQIGMKAGGLGDAGARVRDERLEAGRRVIRAASAYGVDFILVAGDLFEDNGIDRLLVQKVVDILGAFNGPVWIIPGNHDPFVPGSVWEHPSWKSAGNLHVQKEEKAVEIPGGTLYPCPVLERHSARNPVSWIPSEPGNGIRIGLAHGTVEGIRQDEPDYPIPRDAAGRAGLDYLALGHWHSYAAYIGPDGKPHMAYSGTHEPTRFGERDSGNVLIVEIAGPGAPPAITPVRTAGTDWVTIQKEIRERGELASLRKEIETMGNPDKTLVDVVLTGLLMADERAELDHMKDILDSRFLWGRLDASKLRPSPEDEAWILHLPPGPIRDAAMRLRDHPGAAPEIAARALMELYAIAGEAD